MPLTHDDIKGLLACLSVVADGEINAREVECVDREVTFSEEGAAERDKIFSDHPDRATVASLLGRLHSAALNAREKEDVVRLLVKVGFADGFYDSRERAVTRAAAKALDLPERFVEALENREAFLTEEKGRTGGLLWHQRLRGAFDSLIYELSVADGSAADDEELLSGMGFARRVEEITRTAEADLRRAGGVMDETDSMLTGMSAAIHRLYDKVSHKRRENDADMDAVLRSVQDVRERITSILEGSLKENRSILRKKERNIKYFTIAFMGRTKTGKSTLHKVVTHEEKDDIGKGKLRTTRFNRSWFWERLRIVDTPGIGAPGGATDRETAASIIDEADLICYVVTNDSIQPTEFDFLETIKERNKPLFIILNYQMNLDLRPHLKRFLKDPSAWRTAEGSSSLKGHFDRINSMLKGKYNMDAVRIIPVQLIAALMYFSHKDEGFSAGLLEGSNIKELVREIKMTVYRSGALMKSMSVLDGCAYRVHSVASVLGSDLSTLRSTNNALRAKRDEFIAFVDGEARTVERDVATIISTSFNDLRSRAKTFTLDECENRKAGEKWNDDAVVKAVVENLDKRVKGRLDEFSSKVKERIEEMVFDIRFVAPVLDAGSIEGVKIRNTRLIAGIAGTLGALAFSLVWSAVGWGIAVAFAIDAAVNLFKSRDKKRLEAAARLEAKLISHLDRNEREALTGIMRDLSANVASMKKQTDSLMTAFIDGVGEVVALLERGVNVLGRHESTLNSLVAARIMEYLCKWKGSRDETLSDSELTKAISVSRDWKRSTFSVSCRGCDFDEDDAQRASKATQMNVTFNDSEQQ